MQANLSEILDNILGLLLLEGSYDIEEDEEGFKVAIETKDAGRLIGARGESLEGLQLLVNQIISRKNQQESKPEDFKRILIDVMGWRKQKEDELATRARELAASVVESGKEVELEPMSPWQRRIVHMVVSDVAGVVSESVGEGYERHLVIKPGEKQESETIRG